MSKPSRAASGASSTELAASLETAREELIAAEAAVAAAEAAYQAALPDQSAPALRKLRDAKEDASIAVDRATSIIARLERQLETATTSEEEDRRRANFEHAKSLSDAARKRLAEQYPEAAAKIRDVLRAIAEADLAVNVANTALPEGERALPITEGYCSTGEEWRETLSRTEVEMWAAAGGYNTPLGPELQGRVAPNLARGGSEARRIARTLGADSAAVMESTGHVQTENGPLDVVKKKYVCHEYLPDAAGWRIDNLATKIELPPIFASASPFWEPTRGDPASVIAKLDAPLLPPPVVPKRAAMFEYSLIR